MMTSHIKVFFFRAFLIISLLFVPEFAFADDEVVKDDDFTLPISFYRSNYIMTGYNSSPNHDDPLDYDPKAIAQKNEVMYQLSFQTKILSDFFKNSYFWFAYTQRSFWQVFNHGFSAPFRDTNYEPEFFFRVVSDYPVSLIDNLYLQSFDLLLWNHQSNGRSNILSRSWNRTGAQVCLEKGDFNLLLKSWFRWREDKNHDENPDIEDYMGYFELWGTFISNSHIFGSKRDIRYSMMVRNNLQQENRGALQFDVSIPMGQRFALYLQYFNGYGESLLDYNDSSNRVSCGIVLVDWSSKKLQSMPGVNGETK